MLVDMGFVDKPIKAIMYTKETHVILTVMLVGNFWIQPEEWWQEWKRSAVNRLTHQRRRNKASHFWQRDQRGPAVIKKDDVVGSIMGRVKDIQREGYIHDCTNKEHVGCRIHSFNMSPGGYFSSIGGLSSQSKEQKKMQSYLTSG